MITPPPPERRGSSDSQASSVQLTFKPDPYTLLRRYAKDSKTTARAYSLSEAYYRSLSKYLNYPVVALSAVSTVCAGLDINKYVLMGVSLATLILLGFDKAIDPKDREHDANKFAVEYGEIASNIKQFVLSNNRTQGEVKAYSETVYSLLTKWKAMNPPIKQSFVTQAKTYYLERVRKHKTRLHAHPPTPVII